jgi:hypothetical protein
MKLKLCGFVSLMALLAVSPARAITFYDYNVDFTIGTGAGSAEITGSIQTNCDACLLNSANFVTSWSFMAPDGSSINSSEPSAAITISVPGPTNLLEATPTGISTLANATSGGFFLFCGDASDCLTISNVFHSPPQPEPIFHLQWIEGGSPVYRFDTFYNGSAPVIELATLADTVDCVGNLCITTPAATPLPAALPLFVSGLAAMGLLSRRRKQESAAALAAA